MNKKKILLTVLTTLCLQITAQDLATGYKDAGYGNPISPCVFCADPTALVYDGRLYVYGTNDHQQFIANGKKGENNYGAIKSLVIFSTDDMVNWTFHGTIDVAKLCSSWGWRFAASWAPSVTWRETADGKKEFFLYFANSGGSIGVITASSPTGPWKSPLSKPFIDGDTPGVKPCNWIFDPGVLIDDEGTGWISRRLAAPVGSLMRNIPTRSGARSHSATRWTEASSTISIQALEGTSLRPFASPPCL